VTIPVDLSFQGLPYSNAIEEAVAHQLSRLERLRSHITRCRVSLSQEAKHQQQGRPFSVRVDLVTPLSDRISSATPLNKTPTLPCARRLRAWSAC